jgi:hypothetical protein
MERVVYTSNAKIRLKVRKIDELEVNGILKSPQKLYFDTATGALVAIGPRISVKDHWLIVVYTIEGDVIKIMTVIDVSSINNFIRGAPGKGWVD